MLAACTPEVNVATLTPSPTWEEKQTSTTSNRDIAAEITETPPFLILSQDIRLTPTPTPIIYTIEKNDTLIGISNKYGVELEKIIAANPQIDPNLLQVGITLTIPMGEIISSGIPSPTPLPISTKNPICYRTEPSGIICFIPVENTLEQAVDNVTAEVSLYNDEKNQSYKSIASSPIDIIPAHSTIPLVVRFHDIDVNITTINFRLQTALPQPGNDECYIPVQVTTDKVTIASNGISATIKGNVSYHAKNKKPNKINLVVFARDENQQIVGYRKQTINTSENKEEKIPFNITVYSLGLPIADINVLAEGKE